MPSTTPKRGFIKPAPGDLIADFQPNIDTAFDVIDNMIDDADSRLTNQRVPTDGSVTSSKIAPAGLAQSTVVNLVSDLASKVTKAAAGDATRYVSLSGSDLNDGLSTGSAKRTVSAAITALSGVGMVSVAKGTFTEAIDLPSGVIVEGAGRGNTIIGLPNSSNRAVVKTVGFDALTGTDGSGGTAQWGLRHLTIDGNKTNQSSGACWGIRSYGLDFMVSDVTVRNCRTGGIYSEWSTTPTASGDSMESWLVNVKVHDNDGNGIEWRGPHNSKWINVLSFSNIDRGIKIAGAGTGIQAVNCHARGLSQIYAWDIGAVGCQLANCTGESAIVANALISANSTSFSGGLWSGTGVSTTLTSGITNSQTSISVAAGVSITAPFEAVVGAEIIRVTAGEATTTWTIQRAQRGTSGAAHSSADRIYVGMPYNFQIGSGSTITNTKINCATLNGRAAVNFANDGGSVVDIANSQAVGVDRVGSSVGRSDIRTVGGAKNKTHREFPVEEFGAIGDGVTDDTAAILAAIAAAEASEYGGIVRVRAGTYRLTGPVTLHPNGTIAADIQGDGAWLTTFLLDHASARIRVSEGGGVTLLGQRGSRTGGFRIDCNNLATQGLFLGLSDDRTFYDIWITNSPGTGMVIEELQNAQFDKIVVDTCSVGISFDYGANGHVFTSIEIFNCGTSLKALNSDSAAGCHNNLFVGGLIEYFDAAETRPFQMHLDYSNDAFFWAFHDIQFVVVLDTLNADTPFIKIRDGGYKLGIGGCIFQGSFFGGVYRGVALDVIAPGVKAATIESTDFANLKCKYKLDDDTILEVIGDDDHVSVTSPFLNQSGGTNFETNIVQHIQHHTVFHHAANNFDAAYRVFIDGQPRDRLIIQGTGELIWGGGSGDVDTTLYRISANSLKTDGHLECVDGVSTRVKAGVPTDADFLHPPLDGTFAVDSTNNKIYVRIGSTWKSVTVS